MPNQKKPGKLTSKRRKRPLPVPARCKVFTVGPYTYIHTVFPDGSQILKLVQPKSYETISQAVKACEEDDYHDR